MIALELLQALTFLAGAARLQEESPAPARAVTLVELRTAPARFLGEEVALKLQFQSTVEEWNPYLSRFEPGAWLGFAAWADETVLWNAAVFDDPARRLFVRRGGELAAQLGRAHVYQRFEARAVVRETFLGEPWLEVLALAPLEGETGAGTIVHVNRARDLASKGQYDLALEQYERARLAPLPPHALAAILKEILETKEAREATRAEERRTRPARSGKP